jgi:hypothetical protein
MSSVEVDPANGLTQSELVHEETAPSEAVTDQAAPAKPSRKKAVPSEPVREQIVPDEVIHVSEPSLPVQHATPAISLPSGFRFGQVLPRRPVGPLPLAPSLGPLAAFVGNWSGNGFNTIFRPDSPQTPTPLPTPAGGDNVLELNLTSENLAFSPALGSVPNRGMVQADAFLNGVPYLQTINDVTTGIPTGIHVEPGLWMCVPATTDPSESQQTVVRMASIPHGTTILAQGIFSTFAGAPTIPAAPITPFGTQLPGTPLPPPGPGFRFLSQTAAQPGTARIPQDLTSFIAAGTITQAMIDDPNTLLRNHNSGQIITSTTVISISTAPTSPLFGGGTDNIAFLLGTPAALTSPQGGGENAQTIEMFATFWIETVEHSIVVPPFVPGHPPIELKAETTHPSLPVPTFSVRPPFAIEKPRVIKLFSHQIQYSQTVMLNFNRLTWPHVSVATLVPAGPLPVPPSAWA